MQNKLRQVLTAGSNYPFEALQRRNAGSNSRRCIVEFSSPNIAKPFHAGHLRSTMLGNTLANMLERCGHRVVRVNYLGDWGMQYGILARGLRQFGSESAMDKSENQLAYLVDIYSKSSELAESNADYRFEAGEIASALENGDPDSMALWRRLRDISLQQYRTVYDRLEVKFDEWQFESDYAEKARQLFSSSSNSSGCVELEGRESARLLKSDGSSLYLGRDAAALIDRASKYDFDDIYYVTDNHQQKHFETLFSVARQMPLIGEERRLHHIRFGRLLGLSTRRGASGMIVDDIIDEVERVARERILRSPNRRPVDLEWTARKCALSCMIVNDQRQWRKADFAFQPERFVTVTGESGITLQYTHARLNNLERRCGVEYRDNALLGTLIEKEARHLIYQILETPEKVKTALELMEPSYTINHMLHLRFAANKAFRELRVAGEQLELAHARLCLFRAARFTIAGLMEMHGIRPLDAV